MQDSGYNMGGRSVPLPPFSQFFLNFFPCFFPFGTLEYVFRVFVLMSASSYTLWGGPCSTFFNNYPCWNFSGGQSGRPYLSRPRSSLCGEFKKFSAYKMVSVLIYNAYLVTECQERRVIEGDFYEV